MNSTKRFKKYTKKQDVDDSSEAIQDFLDSGDDMLPSEYLNNRVLTEEESNKIEGKYSLRWKDQVLLALIDSQWIGC